MSDSNFLHLVKPTLAAPMTGLSTSPIIVKIQAPALFQILEIVQKSTIKKRVMGSLLGSRSDDGSEIEVKSAYLVPHHEEAGEVSIEEYNHKALLQLYKRTNPKDLVIGWFASSSGIETFTGLVHDFYSSYPHPAIHLAVECRDANNEPILPILNTYVGAQIGSTSLTGAKFDKLGSYLFTPIPNEIIYSRNEKIALNSIYKASLTSDRKLELPTGNSIELKNLDEQLIKINELIDNLLLYINKIINNEIESNEEIIRFLLNNLLDKPCSFSKNELSTYFKNHIQDTILIEYLSKTVKEQLDLSAKLTALV